MFNLNISLLMAFDGLREIVKRFGPDHKNSGACVYATERDGVLNASCIVGQFFADLGLLRVLVGTNENPDLRLDYPGDPVNTADPSGLCNMGAFTAQTVRNLDTKFGITLDPGAELFLLTAQRQQDGGETWANAVEFASQAVIDAGYVSPSDTRPASQKVYDALNV